MSQILNFLKKFKKLLLIPIILTILLFGVLLLLTQGTAVDPFVYAIF